MGLDKGLPFEYSLNGLQTTDIVSEYNAVQKLFSDATDTQIMQALGTNYVPIRIKELQELKKAGYNFLFDEINQSYILTLP